MQYSNNASFAASNLNRQLFPNRTYTILQTTAQLSRQITPQVTANLWYAYIRETQKNIYPSKLLPLTMTIEFGFQSSTAGITHLDGRT